MKKPEYKATSTRQEIIAHSVYDFLEMKINDLKFIDPESIEVTTFFNLREEGFLYNVKDKEGKIIFVFSVYEHRNSDNICINGCEPQNLQTFGAYISNSKWDNIMSFSYKQYAEVGTALYAMIHGIQTEGVNILLDYLKKEGIEIRQNEE